MRELEHRCLGRPKMQMVLDTDDWREHALALADAIATLVLPDGAEACRCCGVLSLGQPFGAVRHRPGCRAYAAVTDVRRALSGQSAHHTFGVCRFCGVLLPMGERGRPRVRCGRTENPDCRSMQDKQGKRDQQVRRSIPKERGVRKDMSRTPTPIKRPGGKDDG
ncbi:MAG: hypothetical protein AMJ46_12535 [Latescibacteria bacterium DG_63]|nr:MAG: hypothetical protein AMJ46_12535 [Latescibacteria bacterium DG_63]